MMDIPYEEAVTTIAESSGLSPEEVQQRIDEKLKQLSGLISKDGAAHIVANELGVKLVEQPPKEQTLKIADLTVHSRGANVTGKVVQKWEVRTFEKNDRKGKVANLLMGDETGVIRLTFWNDQVDVFEALKDGDVIVVQNPFVKQGWQDRLELQLNDQSSIQVNPDGVTVEVQQREETPREQKYIKDLVGGEENVEIVATIVQMFEPRFYDACPECRKKVDGNLCPTHGEVKPDVNFNVAAFLDDGTGNIRTSFWKKQSLVLTGVDEETFGKIRGDPTLFEPVKTELLGEIIKVIGRVKKNDDFDRLEMNAQLVFKDVDPQKEMQNLEKKFEQDRQKPEKKVVENPVEKPAQQKAAPEEPGVKEEVISLDDLEDAE